MAGIDRQVRRLMGKAIVHYGLIEDGDRIAVGVSGGKDSLLLLWLLRERLARIPIRYELVAVHVDPGFGPETAEALEAFLTREGFEHRILRTDHGPVAHGPGNRENPCFLCSRLRRTKLFEQAGQEGCGKVALGHNQDDLIETFFLNICFGAQVATMLPRQSFFGGKIDVIRPLALVPADAVSRLGKKLGLPTLPNPCPSADRNKRREIRGLLGPLMKSNPKVRGNIFHAMSHINLEYLPPPLTGMSGIPSLKDALPLAQKGSGPNEEKPAQSLLD